MWSDLTFLQTIYLLLLLTWDTWYKWKTVNIVNNNKQIKKSSIKIFKKIIRNSILGDEDKQYWWNQVFKIKTIPICLSTISQFKVQSMRAVISYLFFIFFNLQWHWPFSCWFRVEVPVQDGTLKVVRNKIFSFLNCLKLYTSLEEEETRFIFYRMKYNLSD